MYSASSVKNALTANSNLEFDDFGCPRTNPNNWNSSAVCCKDVKICSYSLNRKCEQKVKVINSHPPSVYILVFHFTIVPHTPDGFIDENDSSLMTMIRKGLIDTKLLKIA